MGSVKCCERAGEEVTVTFSLYFSRMGFLIMAAQLVWAAIRGTECVWFKEIKCDSLSVD